MEMPQESVKNTTIYDFKMENKKQFSQRSFQQKHLLFLLSAMAL
jgi:hypothetical protein